MTAPLHLVQVLCQRAKVRWVSEVARVIKNRFGEFFPVWVPDREAFAEFLMRKSAAGKSDELEAARQEPVVEKAKQRGDKAFPHQFSGRAENYENRRFDWVGGFELQEGLLRELCPGQHPDNEDAEEIQGKRNGNKFRGRHLCQPHKCDAEFVRQWGGDEKRPEERK